MTTIRTMTQDSEGEDESESSKFFSNPRTLSPSVLPREKPLIHLPQDPPLCEKCRQLDVLFYDPACQDCLTLLMGPTVTVPEIFAILRQWTPQAQCNLETLVTEILKRGVNINDRDGLTDMTLLHYASKSGAKGLGDVEHACRVVEHLLSLGADVFVRCRWTNMTALHYAVYFNIAPVVKILLKASKCVDIESRCVEFDRGAPLHIAACNIARESAMVLLDHSADPLSRDDSGRMPVDCIPDLTQLEPGSSSYEVVLELKKLLEDGVAVRKEQVENKVTTSDKQLQDALRSLGIKIGERVLVGGIKTGILRFCGKTMFASGIWAGIELDESVGKNDGSVGGISYFYCPPKYGIFAPLSKISRPGILVYPITTGRVTTGVLPSRSSMSFGKVDTSRVTAKVDTGLGSRHYPPFAPNELAVGDTVLVAGQRKGIIRYSGTTDFAPGWWYGVELEKAVGKNDGSINGRQYFTCEPKFGIFAPAARLQKWSSNANSSSSLNESAQDIRQTPQYSDRLIMTASGMRSIHSMGSLSLRRTAPIVNRHQVNGSLGSRRTNSATSLLTGSPASWKLQEGVTVLCNGQLGTIRYIGAVDFAEGIWLGVELRAPTGRNDGSVRGRRYFTCKPNYGAIVRPSKVSVHGINCTKLLGIEDESSVK